MRPHVNDASKAEPAGLVSVHPPGANIVQACMTGMAQLIALHARSAAKLPLFGVVSDGLRFVFLSLTPTKVLRSKMYRLATVDELCSVLMVINELFLLAETSPAADSS